MDEALFAQLATILELGRSVVLASVLDTHGSTPRQRGARMLIEPDAIHASVGGGAMEARVIDAARALMIEGGERVLLDIALDGRAGSAGICGGSMRLVLRHWRGAAMTCRSRELAKHLARGECLTMRADELGVEHVLAQKLYARPRLLVAGAGHCGHALAQMAKALDFDVWVADSRSECFAYERFAGVQVSDASAANLQLACASPRDLYIVLLSRDFPADVAVLTSLAGVSCRFIGMMGSRRRIAQVHAALPHHAAWLAQITAPIGMEIGAQTPYEIAVSILAQLIACRGTARSVQAGDVGT